MEIALELSKSFICIHAPFIFQWNKLSMLKKTVDANLINLSLPSFSLFTFFSHIKLTLNCFFKIKLLLTK